MTNIYKNALLKTTTEAIVNYNNGIGNNSQLKDANGNDTTLTQLYYYKNDMIEKYNNAIGKNKTEQLIILEFLNTIL